LCTIIAERTDRVEAMIAAEARGAGSFDEIEQQVILVFLRLGSHILPARPLAARKKSGCFQKDGHFALSAHVMFGGCEALQEVFRNRYAEAA
jgi:hypothetical protein